MEQEKENSLQKADKATNVVVKIRVHKGTAGGKMVEKDQQASVSENSIPVKILGDKRVVFDVSASAKSKKGFISCSSKSKTLKDGKTITESIIYKQKWSLKKEKQQEKMSKKEEKRNRKLEKSASTEKKDKKGKTMTAHKNPSTKDMQEIVDGTAAGCEKMKRNTNSTSSSNLEKVKRQKTKKSKAEKEKNKKKKKSNKQSKKGKQKQEKTKTPPKNTSMTDTQETPAGNEGCCVIKEQCGQLASCCPPHSLQLDKATAKIQKKMSKSKKKEKKRKVEKNTGNQRKEITGMQEQQSKEEKKRRNTLLHILTVLLLVAVGGTLLYFYTPMDCCSIE